MQRAGVGSGDFSSDTQHLARRRLIGGGAAAVAGGVRHHGSGFGCLELCLGSGRSPKTSYWGERYWSPGKTVFLAIFFSHLNSNTPVQVALKTELSHSSTVQTEYPKIAKEMEKPAVGC